MKTRLIGNATLILADCSEALPTLTDIDACVTDPPYGLSFMGAKWDHDVPRVELWKLVNATLKPGGHLLSFFGSRTYHRGAVEIEDAGFDIRDQIQWIYGSGFPKSLDVSKAIDKAAGAEREVIGLRTFADGSHARATAGSSGVPSSGAAGQAVTTAPKTDEARQWEGWGTSLKPAHEPIVMARKPFKATVAANVLTTGCGALNIDACRVGTESTISRAGSTAIWNNAGQRPMAGSHCGRWPANVIHDGSDEVLTGFPESDRTKARTGVGQRYGGLQGGSAFAGDRRYHDFGEKGSAARFFYCAKASKKDREVGNLHPTVKPTALMRYLCRLVTPPGGIVLDPFMGSGSTGKAALAEGFRFIGIERDPEFFEIACKRIEAAQTVLPRRSS